MQLEVKGWYERFDMSLLGWDKGKFIIAKYSPANTLNFHLTSMDVCTMRFLEEGIAHGFTTKMQSMQYHPAPLMFFEYPPEVVSMPVRKYNRVKTNIAARYMTGDSSEHLVTDDARILDISETGCLIEVSKHKVKRADLGNSCYLHFMILDKTLELDCLIKNVRNKEESYLLGVIFNGVSSTHAEILKMFLNMVEPYCF